MRGKSEEKNKILGKYIQPIDQRKRPITHAYSFKMFQRQIQMNEKKSSSTSIPFQIFVNYDEFHLENKVMHKHKELRKSYYSMEAEI